MKKLLKLAAVAAAVVAVVAVGKTVISKTTVKEKQPDPKEEETTLFV